MQPKNFLNILFYDEVSFYLLLAWVTMPIFILIGQTLKLDQIIGNLFLIYITVLGLASFLIVSMHAYKVYKINGIYYFKQNLIKRPWNLAFLAMLFWSLSASLLADDLLLAFYGTFYRNDGFFTYCIYAAIYCCAQINKSENLRKKVFQYFILSSLPLCLVTILQYFNCPTEVLGIYYQERLLSNMRYAAIFYNTNHYGYYLTMIIATSAGLYWQSNRTLEQSFYMFIFILNAWCLIINNTFGSYLSVFFICIIAPALLYRKSTKINKTTNLMPLMLFLLLTISSSQIVTNNFQVLSTDVKNIAAENTSAKNAGSKRWELWTNGVDMLKYRPIFGYGPENLGKEYLARGIDQDRPHNEYLQHALFLGLPALIFYMNALFMLLKNWLTNRQNLNGTSFVSGLTVIAYLFSAFFGNTMFYTTIYFFLLLGYISQDRK
ncbi:MAG: O-antigen ligase family protein [Acidaminococcaceae bacterium]